MGVKDFLVMFYFGLVVYVYGDNGFGNVEFLEVILEVEEGVVCWMFE